MNSFPRVAVAALVALVALPVACTDPATPVRDEAAGTSPPVATSLAPTEGVETTVQPSTTETEPEPIDDTVAMDPAAVADELQSQLDALVGATGVPGATMAIGMPGYDDVLLASGVSNTATGQAMATDEVFRVGSVTKTFTAAIVLALIDEGRLALDDTLDQWYPDVPNADRITIELLLEHRAGTNDISAAEQQALLLGDLEHSYTIDEVVGLVAGRPALFEPGEGTGYSNMGFRLLGGVVEKVTGQPLAVEIEQRITTPLALASTILDDGSGPPPSHGYFSLDGGATYLDVADFPNQAALTIAGPAGAVDSSLPDLLRWAQALYGGDVLSPATTELLLGSLREGWQETDNWIVGMGVLGFCPCGAAAPYAPLLVGHDGGFIGSATLMVLEPTTGLAIAVHANRDADAALMDGFVELARSASAMLAAGTTEPAGVRVLLDEQFDDDGNGWGGPWQTYTAGVAAWSLPDGQVDSRAPDTLIAIEGEIDDAVITTEFVAPGAESVAVECAYEVSDQTSRWYSVSLGRNGAQIRKQPFGQGVPQQDLAATQDAMLTNDQTVMTVTCRLTADGYLLALAVDGSEVLKVVDADAFGAGAPGLSVQALREPNDAGPTATFDSFVVEVPVNGPELAI